MATGVSKMTLPLYSAVIRPHPQWGPQHQKEVNLLEQVQRRATELIRRLEHLSCGRGAEAKGSQGCFLTQTIP